MYDTLISAQDLAANLTKFRVLDCRARLGDPQFGQRAYAAGHIPGAVHADLDRDFAAPPGSGGRHPLPDPAALVTKLRAWGINAADQLVMYDDAGGAFAARAWWCLRWLGHPAAAVLDGGLDAWIGELSTTPPPSPPGDFHARAPLTRTVSAAQLATAMNGQHPPWLLDARSTERFAGEQEPIDPVAGHIPGALCRPFQDNLDTAGRFWPVAALAERFADVAGDCVCYCGSGVTAAHNILALRVAGHPEPALYPGSWSEWILDPSRPREP